MKLPKEVMDGMRDTMRMHAKLQMIAYQELYNAVKMKSIRISKREREALEMMNLQAQKNYDNIDEMLDDVLNDPTAIPLMQASMGDLMEKWKDK